MKVILRNPRREARRGRQSRIAGHSEPRRGFSDDLLPVRPSRARKSRRALDLAICTSWMPVMACSCHHWEIELAEAEVLNFSARGRATQASRSTSRVRSRVARMSRAVGDRLARSADDLGSVRAPDAVAGNGLNAVRSAGKPPSPAASASRVSFVVSFPVAISAQGQVCTTSPTTVLLARLPVGLSLRKRFGFSRLRRHRLKLVTRFGRLERHGDSIPPFSRGPRELPVCALGRRSHHVVTDRRRLASTPWRPLTTRPLRESLGSVCPKDQWRSPDQTTI